jgi:hypothetical protein
MEISQRLEAGDGAHCEVDNRPLPMDYIAGRLSDSFGLPRRRHHRLKLRRAAAAPTLYRRWDG